MSNENNKLKSLIEEKYGTVYAFVRETGIPQSYLYQILKGAGNPTVEIINKLAAALEISPDEVFKAING